MNRSTAELPVRTKFGFPVEIPVTSHLTVNFALWALTALEIPSGVLRVIVDDFRRGVLPQFKK
jgi:hypothetical protein